MPAGLPGSPELAAWLAAHEPRPCLQWTAGCLEVLDASNIEAGQVGYRIPASGWQDAWVLSG